MTNSEDSRRRAADILRQIRLVIDESPWQHTIDTVIEEELDRSEGTLSPVTIRQLIDHVTQTVQQIYARLPNVRRCLGASQARDEASYLLAFCFPGAGAEGLDAAMLTAMDENTPGIEVLYRRLGEVLKERMRRAHVDWVFARHLDPIDWETNHAIAELLLGQFRATMPEGAPSLPPEAFVDCIPDLFFAVQNIESSTLSVLLNRFLRAL